MMSSRPGESFPTEASTTSSISLKLALIALRFSSRLAPIARPAFSPTLRQPSLAYHQGTPRVTAAYAAALCSPRCGSCSGPIRLCLSHGRRPLRVRLLQRLATVWRFSCAPRPSGVISGFQCRTGTPVTAPSPFFLEIRASISGQYQLHLLMPSFGDCNCINSIAYQQACQEETSKRRLCPLPMLHFQYDTELGAYTCQCRHLTILASMVYTVRDEWPASRPSRAFVALSGREGENADKI